MTMSPRSQVSIHGPTRSTTLPAAGSVLLVTFSALLLLAVTGILIPTLGILLLLFGGVLLGIFLHDVTRLIARIIPIGYRWCFAITVVLLFSTIVGTSYYMGAQFVDQVSQLTDELAAARDRLSERLNQNEWLKSYLPTTEQLKDGFSGLGGSMLSGVQTAVWGITGALVVLVTGLYLAYDPELYVDGILKLLPQDKREEGARLFCTLHHTLRYWIIGRLTSMTIIGVITSIGLWLFGVPLPITLGAFSALLTFIPNIGPILAAIPQALLALQLGGTTVIYVLIFNVVLQTVESYAVTPIIQRYAATLPPVLTISAQLLMGVVVGLIGVIFAAPLTAAVMVSVQLLYIKEKLHDPEPGDLVERC